jgi:DtxR family Mn-dependent transcriptional regulator
VSPGREQAENALKHLLGQSSAGHATSLSSLQGALRANDRTLLAITERLEREGLIRTEGTEFRLTTEGERLALQVVRAHRLWELYLADELGVPVGQVHAKAERAEHFLSPEDVDRLSAAMGHPETDPHGDPIPGRDGELVTPEQTPLSAGPTGTPGRIVHLEDEPPLAYAQLTALGLRLGQIVHIIDATATRLVLSDDENETCWRRCSRATCVAPARPLQSPPKRCCGCPICRQAAWAKRCRSIRASVIHASPAAGPRLHAGARIRPDLTTFAGDPRAYRLRGTTIALRRDQSERVLVRAVA